jgi:hypothetical protein
LKTKKREKKFIDNFELGMIGDFLDLKPLKKVLFILSLKKKKFGQCSIKEYQRLKDFHYQKT